MSNINDDCNSMNLNRLKFSSNFEYRKYLTHNAKKILHINNDIINYNQQCHCNYHQKIDKNTKKNNPPFLFTSINQTDTPNGYTESDLKTNFINNRLRNFVLDNFEVVNPY